MDSSKEQFSLIYDQYIEKIYRFVYLKVNSQEIAEDIASKVFLSGWESYKNQKVIENPGAYLYKIARNMVVDHYREKGRTKTISTDQIPQAIDTKTDLHERAILSSDIELVRHAMRNLKEDYQDILIWHYLDDMPIEEICTVLNKSNGAVRVMLHRGLKALRDELIEEV